MLSKNKKNQLRKELKELENIIFEGSIYNNNYNRDRMKEIEKILDENCTSEVINNLKKRKKENPFFHLTGSKEEKAYIRENGCTYTIRGDYQKFGVITDKITGDGIIIQLYDESEVV